MALASGLVAVPTAWAKGRNFDATEFPGYAATFRLQGSNGYSIEIDAYSREERERILIAATRKGSAAFYSAPVQMTATTISADLGSLGKVDLHLNPSGVTSAAAFRFQPDLRTATFSGPSLFSGSASISRSRDSVSPLWTGGLALDFPGRSDVPLAGPSFHVSLVHARFNCSKGGSVAVSVRPRCGFHR